MKIGRYLKSFLAAPLALSLAGCHNDFPQYHFNGVVEGRKITFTEHWNSPSGNTLEVENPDGSKAIYRDLGWDLKLDEFIIEKDGNKAEYRKGTPEIEAAQRQFDSWLEKIKDAKNIKTPSMDDFDPSKPVKVEAEKKEEK